MTDVKLSRPVIEIWEPTYQMVPKDIERFRSDLVEKIIKEVVDNRMSSFQTWDETKSKSISSEIVAEVKEKIKGEK